MWCFHGLLRPQALGLLVLAFFSCSHMTYSFPYDGVKGQAVKKAPHSSGNAGSRGVSSAPFNTNNGTTDGAVGVSGYSGIGVAGQSLDDSVRYSTTASTPGAPVSLGLTSASSSLQQNVTLSNDSALSALSEVPPFAAGGSQDTVNSYGNSDQASAAPPVSEKTPSPQDTTDDGGNPGIGVAGQSLDDSVRYSTAASNSEAPVSLGLTSTGSSLQQNVTLSNGSALSALSEVPPLAAGESQDTVNSYGNSDQAGAAPPVSEKTPSPQDTTADGGNTDLSDTGADANVSSYYDANKGSDDNDDDEVIVVVVSNDSRDGNDDGTDVKGSDDNDDDEVIDVAVSSDSGDDNNDGTDVKGSDVDHDDDSGTFMKDPSDSGADANVSSYDPANTGSDDNEDDEVIVVAVSSDSGDDNNDGTDVKGSDGDHDDDSGTFMKGPGDSAGVKGHHSAPVKA